MDLKPRCVFISYYRVSTMYGYKHMSIHAYMYITTHIHTYTWLSGSSEYLQLSALPHGTEQLGETSVFVLVESSHQPTLHH